MIKRINIIDELLERDMMMKNELKDIHYNLLKKLFIIGASFTIIFVLLMWAINRTKITEVDTSVERMVFKVDKLDRTSDTIVSVLGLLLRSDSVMDVQLRHFPSSPPLDLAAMSRVSSNYNKRLNPFTKEEEFHWGVDYRSPKNSMVYAAGEGLVEKAEWDDGHGRVVKINHGNGYSTFYAHLDSIKVTRGQYVRKGERIGTVGLTGMTTGYHLHYEISYQDSRINPKIFTQTY